MKSETVVVKMVERKAHQGWHGTVVQREGG